MNKSGGTKQSGVGAKSSTLPALARASQMEALYVAHIASVPSPTSVERLLSRQSPDQVWESLCAAIALGDKKLLKEGEKIFVACALLWADKLQHLSQTQEQEKLWGPMGSWLHTAQGQGVGTALAMWSGKKELQLRAYGLLGAFLAWLSSTNKISSRYGVSGSVSSHSSNSSTPIQVSTNEVQVDSMGVVPNLGKNAINAWESMDIEKDSPVQEDFTYWTEHPQLIVTRFLTLPNYWATFFTSLIHTKNEKLINQSLASVEWRQHFWQAQGGQEGVILNITLALLHYNLKSSEKLFTFMSLQSGWFARLSPSQFIALWPQLIRRPKLVNQLTRHPELVKHLCDDVSIEELLKNHWGHLKSGELLHMYCSDARVSVDELTSVQAPIEQIQEYLEYQNAWTVWQWVKKGLISQKRIKMYLDRGAPGARDPQKTQSLIEGFLLGDQMCLPSVALNLDTKKTKILASTDSVQKRL